MLSVLLGLAVSLFPKGEESMAYQTIIVEIEDYVALIRLNRPEALNALNSQLMRELGAKGRVVIRKSGTEPVIRVMAEGDDEKLVKSVVGSIVSVIEKAA